MNLLFSRSKPPKSLIDTDNNKGPGVPRLMCKLTKAIAAPMDKDLDSDKNEKSSTAGHVNIGV